MGGVARFGYARPWLVLGLCLLVTVPASVALRSLSLDPDLVSLLPSSFPSVRAVKQLEQRYGGVGFLSLVLDGEDNEVLVTLAERLAPKLEALESVDYVLYERDTPFFAEKLGYYLGVDQLTRFVQRLEERIEWERQRRNPLFVRLEDTEAPPVDSTTLLEGTDFPAARLARQLEGRRGRYYLDRSDHRLLMLIKPRGLASDLAFDRRLTAEVRALLRGEDLGGVRVAFSGRYQKRLDMQTTIRADLSVTAWVALGGILLFIGLYFRSVIAVLLVMMPLLLGLAWSYAAAAVLFGTVNILTAFIGAILLGLGIDHGIHLLVRVGLETGSTTAQETAVVQAFSRAGGPVLLAALTTSVGFVALAVSELRAFREFGVVASIGMVAIIVAYALCLPALLSLAARLGWRMRPRRPSTNSRAHRLLARASAPAVVACAALVGLLAWPARGASFNYEFSALEAGDLPSSQLDPQINRIVGRSQTPVLLLSARREQERDVVAAVRAMVAARAEASTIEFALARDELVPRRQEEKEVLLRRIGELLREVPRRSLTEEEREQLEILTRAAGAEPFGPGDLPAQIVRELAYDRTGVGGMVLVFPRVSLSDGLAVLAMARELRAAPYPHPVLVAGEGLVFADVIELVRREAPGALALAGLGIILVLALLLGSARATLYAAVPAVLTMVMTLGLMPLVGLQFDYLNIVMVPVLAGLAMDGGVHLVEGTRRAGLSVAYAEAGDGIAGSILTSAIGFGALLLAHHNGLASLGALALLGLATNVLATLVALPILLTAFGGARGETVRSNEDGGAPRDAAKGG